MQLAVVVTGGDACFVVAQAGFHVRHDLAQGLERECVEFVEADFGERFDRFLAAR